MRYEVFKQILNDGVDVWNSRKEKSLSQPIDLSRIKLNRLDLTGINLSEATLKRVEIVDSDLKDANLSQSNLYRSGLAGSNFENANLRNANLAFAGLEGVTFRNTDLRNANLIGANLVDADLTDANLEGADLTNAVMIRTNLSRAILTDCRVFGISAWKVNTSDAVQEDLRISDYDEPRITIDNLEIAQFVYLMLNNEKIRDIIDTIGKKAVLILGRFSPARKNVLDKLREEMRKRNYVPILFDFDKPSSRSITETVVTLAHLSRFVIADLTNAKATPQELQAIIPHMPSVAIQPIIKKTQKEYGMFEHFKKYQWVMPIYRYQSNESLIRELADKVISPVESFEM